MTPQLALYSSLLTVYYVFSMMKVALISFGCAKNLVDSEVMLGHLRKSGYTLISDPEEADVIIVNTCGFIKPAKDESREALRKFVSVKANAQEKKVIAAGCFVERYRDTLEKQFPEVDSWIGVGDFDKIVQAIEEKQFEKSEACFLYDHTSPRLVSTPPGWAYVKISEGCSHECSFCAIPLIKGPYCSRPIPSILKEVELLASSGVKEVNLISQDTTYFGRDRGEKDGLVPLLRELLAIKGIEWVRILYGYPEEITDPLLEILQEKKICSYLDLPFQHSDPQLLKLMKRGMEGTRALKLIEKIRTKVPGVALRTAIIVGFPGETKSKFNALKRLCKNARFNHLGVFTYSQEDGTSSFSLGETVAEMEKMRRKEEIMEMQTEISYSHNRNFLNKCLEVLIEGTLKEDPKVLVGRTQFQAPEVDGVVFIPFDEDISEVVNTIQKVEIVECDVYDLHGKLIQ